MEGKYVRLRAVEETDLPFCQLLYNDLELRRLVVGWDFPVSLAQQKRWFETSQQDRNNIRLIIENKEKESIGLTGLWDIDWHDRHALTAVKLLLSDENKGKGYGRDAVMTVCAYAFFEVGLFRLWTTIINYNAPSFKTYVERSGWKVEGLLRQHVFRNGKSHDLYYVGCLREDFLAVSDAIDYVPSEIPAGYDIIPPKEGQV
ncbi:MAG: hypothetical protein A4E65_00197 [Syntrophorhabdus sp. PtaU1.Bin153]|nr:MAG: hypothetical protein A4E65_00197 [Syntrophorhabdus sp. PtaU1.Bin153]